MVYRPKAVFPSPPENTIVRGQAVSFVFDTGGLTPYYVYLQIAENRTDAGCNYWHVTSNSNATLTSDGTNPAGVTGFSSTLTTVDFAASAFNSLTKNNGYRWRVKIQYGDSYGYETSAWSDWQTFFTTASGTYLTITTPTAIYYNRVLNVAFDNSGPPLIGARIKVTYNTKTMYDQTIGILVPTNNSGVYQTPLTVDNDKTYTLTVQPKFSSGAWGTASTQNFFVSFTRLSTPTLSISEVNGFVTLSCTSPTVAVNPILSIDLYRWSPQRQEYVLLSEGMSPSFTYKDISAPVNTQFWYRIVAKAASLSDVFTTPSYTDVEDNWFITDGTTRLNVVALASEFGRSHVLDEAEPLGRNFKVVSRFESASREGSMSIDVRPEERDIIIPALYGMADKTVAILSPYGDTFVGNIVSLSVQDDIYGSAVASLGFIEEVPS